MTRTHVTTYVLDAPAMVAYLNGELGQTVVAGCIADTDARCLAHAVNLCKVFYSALLRATDEKTARQAISDLFEDGVIPRRDMSRRFWFGVGRLKARGNISLADCFCIALARQTGGTVVTSDHGEFGPLVALDLCPILFIR